jgi:autoinducer 2-degrading protein
MYVVVVSCEVRTEDLETFHRLLLENRAASLAEPGCRRFDVCVSADPTRYLLYELYDDAAGFEAHLAAPHFATFDALSRPMLTGKRVEIFAWAH